MIYKLESLNILDNNFQNDTIYQQTLYPLTILENEISNEIYNSNNNNKNLVISEQDTDIQNIVQENSFLIQDLFYSQEDESDKVYNKLIKEEKINIINAFYSNQKKVINIITEESELNSISHKKDKIINGIVEGKNIDEFIKYKIIKEIKKIANDPDNFNITSMTILLVGRKEVGKTSLIKYILGPYINSKIIDEYFTLYTSNKINLRLIEVKGVWFDENITPEKIKEKIKNFIDIMNKSNENQNFNNVVNCIWYAFQEEISNKKKNLFSFL